MTSLHRFAFLVGILALFFGVNFTGATAQGSQESSITLVDISAEEAGSNPTEWNVFVVLAIEQAYWDSIESYSLNININGQNEQLSPDSTYEVANTNEHAFTAIFSNLEKGTYLVLVQWNDETTPRVWTGEEIHLGEVVEADPIHEYGPIIALITIVATSVVFPGKIKKTIDNNETQTMEAS